MELDPHFLFTFFSICPQPELCDLMQKSHPFISMSFLAKHVQSCSTLNAEKVRITLLSQVRTKFLF